MWTFIAVSVTLIGWTVAISLAVIAIVAAREMIRSMKKDRMVNLRDRKSLDQLLESEDV